MKYIALLVGLLSLTQATAASFDCRKATSFVEKTICSEPLLSKLDEALASNYRRMLESDFGGTKQSLRAEQLRWLATRNSCSDAKCILEAYRKRVNETCDYGVVTGVHPICTSAEDIISPEPQTPPTPTATPDNGARDTPTTPEKPSPQQILVKHAKEIAALGFDPKLLKGTIYLRIDMANQPQRFATFEMWIAAILESGRYSRVSPISLGEAKGVLLKRAGIPSGGFLFQYDDGDLFPTHFVQGDDATKITSPDEMLFVSLGIVKAMNPD